MKMEKLNGVKKGTEEFPRKGASVAQGSQIPKDCFNFRREEVERKIRETFYGLSSAIARLRIDFRRQSDVDDVDVSNVYLVFTSEGDFKSLSIVPPTEEEDDIVFVFRRVSVYEAIPGLVHAGVDYWERPSGSHAPGRETIQMFDEDLVRDVMDLVSLFKEFKEQLGKFHLPERR